VSVGASNASQQAQQAAVIVVRPLKTPNRETVEAGIQAISQSGAAIAQGSVVAARRTGVAIPDVGTGDRPQLSRAALQPYVINEVLPVYPETARLNGISGQVVLVAVIGKDGYVKTVRVVSGNRFLAEAAVLAILQWRYKPYTRDGRPIEVETEIRVNFENPTESGMTRPPN
jgi:TonB family protein